MNTAELLDALPAKTVIGTLPRVITGIADDSRKVGAGECFVAVPGLRQDARRFIPDAVGRGAALVVTETAAVPGVDVAQVVVPSAREAVALLGDAWHRHPTRAMTVVGITGTNGKTTTSYLVEALLRALGLRTGVLGTIRYVGGTTAMDANQTTPDALQLLGLLAQMRDDGVNGISMEVSSHALAQARVEALAFDVAVFTNLTQDHLDFHGTFDEYRRAKRRLFELLARSPKPRRTAVVNVDDAAGTAMVTGLPLDVIRFGLTERAEGHADVPEGHADVPEVRALEYSSALDGIRMIVSTPAGRFTLTSPLIGEHNVMNLLGAIGAGLALGLAPDTIATTLADVGAVPGRFEQVKAGQPFLVVVDYAHTPDALERVLTTARKLTGGRLGVVFGCGGDRDRTKRPIMGAIAARLSDQVWVTSDNPRSEQPRAIIDEIVAGVRETAGAAGRYVTEPDRAAAIRAALAWGRAGDTVVIAGKGHETYQIVGTKVLPFDDREVARQALTGG
ncbi:MAG: UDP-N-acetylmuramoyl-L-alanyl-D-glutamate--2,6-diaminopimelate ligase [Candidatus Rokubacteria bacterium]|nr:UDP-N-acetylmuramoyl-L-alanyl-D-glutamate--2,6-diaminopimelate ligase [Candidatus Rokubacteria bacterium]